MEVVSSQSAEESLLHRLDGLSGRRLARSASHEINNLLTALSGYNEMARLDAPPEVDFYLACISEVCQRLKGYSNSLAAYGERPGAFTLPFEPGPFLVGLVKDYPALEVLGAEGLPEMLGCPDALRDAVRELCANGLSAGAQRLTLSCRVESRSCSELGRVDARPGYYVVLALSDDGRGFDRQWTGRMQEPHQRDKVRGGRGLGLPAVAGFAGSQGGWLEVASSASGSCVSLVLPPSGGAFEEGRVYVVVDPVCERGARVRVLLESAGAEVIPVRSVAEGARFSAAFPAARVVDVGSWGLGDAPSTLALAEAVRGVL